MDAPAPFTTCAPSTDSLAWVGGVQTAPLWRRGARGVDAAGFHALVRAAGLPLTELLHMGFVLADLRDFADALPLVRAEELLGRIAWDAEYGEAGRSYGADTLDPALALALGCRVVEAWFS